MLRQTGYGPSQIVVMKAPATPEAAGLSLDAVPGDPWMWLARLVLENAGLVDIAVESGNWSDVDIALRTPWICVASDGAALDADHISSKPHPRSWGAFPAAYRRMRDAGTPVGEAVRRMTTAPASRVGLRSGIAAGARADLVVFDDVRFQAAATLAAPTRPASGVEHVYVNGTAVLRHGRQTDAMPGTLMREVSHG